MGVIFKKWDEQKKKSKRAYSTYEENFNDICIDFTQTYIVLSIIKIVVNEKKEDEMLKKELDPILMLNYCFLWVAYNTENCYSFHNVKGNGKHTNLDMKEATEFGILVKLTIEERYSLQ